MEKKFDFLGFNNTVNTYKESQVVSVVDYCFAYMFTNLGDTPATVNGMIIFPSTVPATLGDSRTIMAHKGDVYKGNIVLSFLQPVGANPNVEIVQLFYIQVKEQN